MEIFVCLKNVHKKAWKEYMFKTEKKIVKNRKFEQNIETTVQKIFVILGIVKLIVFFTGKICFK